VRSDMAVTEFNGQLFMAGGENNGTPMNDVWSSADGINWTSVTSAAQFSPRYLLQLAALDNQLFVYGGLDLVTGYPRDVWSSSDGRRGSKSSRRPIGRSAISPPAPCSAISFGLQLASIR
jgi:hypothetical protein